MLFSILYRCPLYWEPLLWKALHELNVFHNQSDLDQKPQATIVYIKQK